MRQLRRWWNLPADYAWTVDYHRRNSVTRDAHVAIGCLCWLFSLSCLLLTMTSRGLPDGIGRVLALVLTGASAVIGVAWMKGAWPNKTWSLLYVLYYEFSVAAVPLLLKDSAAALPFSIALGVIGSYVAVFHSLRLFLVHQVWAVAVVVVLYARAISQPGADIFLLSAYLILLAVILFSAPLLTQAVLASLRTDAATSFFDPLTGLRNRRGLDAAMTEFDTQSQPVAAMVLDIDSFKLVNDRFGHSHGDRVLRAVATTMETVFPPPAVTARIGGEEFVVVGSIGEANAVQADILRERVSADAAAGVTISVGVAHTTKAAGPVPFARLVSLADSAMYSAKRTGGNSVHVISASGVGDVDVDTPGGATDVE